MRGSLVVLLVALLVALVQVAVPARIATAVAASVAATPMAGAPVATATGDGSLVVRLLERVEVNGPEIHLGEIAHRVSGSDERWAALAQLVVGPAPLPGDRRTLVRGAVERRLRQARVDVQSIVWDGPVEQVEVQTLASTLPSSVVEATLAAHVGPVWRLEQVQLPESLRLPQGKPEARVRSGPPVVRPGLNVFAVEILVDGQPAREVWVRATLAPAGGSGGVAAPGVANAAGRSPAAFGQSAPPRADGRPLPAGTGLRLVAVQGAVRVAAPAILRAPGVPGQTVVVENQMSGRQVLALLVSPEEAHAIGPTGEDVPGGSTP